MSFTSSCDQISFVSKFSLIKTSRYEPYVCHTEKVGAPTGPMKVDEILTVMVSVQDTTTCAAEDRMVMTP